MAFVDLARKRLVLKLLVAGPPEVGKSSRLEQVGAVGGLQDFASGDNPSGRARATRSRPQNRPGQPGESAPQEVFSQEGWGRTRMARFPLAAEKEGRPVELELYEWHGPERADVRAKGLFIGLDGLIYLADAREDRLVDSLRTFEFVRERVGKSKLDRLHGLLVLGRVDEGVLGLPTFALKLRGPQWTEQVGADHRDPEPFLDALRRYGAGLLERVF